MKKQTYRHVTRDKRVLKVSFNQLINWNKLAKHETARSIARKSSNLKFASTRKLDSVEIARIYNVSNELKAQKQAKKAKRVEYRKHLKEEYAQREIEYEAKEAEKESKTVCVQALIGMKYSNKKEPLYAELAAKFYFKNRDNYSSAALIDAMKNKVETLMADWWETSVHNLVEESVWITEGTDEEKRFGIVDDNMPNPDNKSSIDWEFYVTQSFAKKQTHIDRDSEENVLDR